MPTSSVTKKWQTTLPAEIRASLAIEPGDRLSYESTPQGILIRRVRRALAGLSPLEAALAVDWNSPEDREDFKDL